MMSLCHERMAQAFLPFSGTCLAGPQHGRFVHWLGDRLEPGGHSLLVFKSQFQQTRSQCVRSLGFPLGEVASQDLLNEGFL